MEAGGTDAAAGAPRAQARLGGPAGAGRAGAIAPRRARAGFDHPEELNPVLKPPAASLSKATTSARHARGKVAGKHGAVTSSGKLFRAPTPILVGIALVLYAGFVRWPYRGVIWEDESFFLIVGHQWLLGLPPYVGAFDVKPPGLFALVALAEGLLGPTFAAMKALEAVAVGATSVALWIFGRRHLSPRVGLVAGLLYPPASLALGGVSSPTELVTSAFVAVAFLIGWEAAQADKPRPLGWLAAGLLMGAAMSVKQTAAFETAAFGLALLTRPQGMRWPALAACVLGCAAIPAGFAAFYAAGGHFHALLDDAVLGALGRVKGDGLSWTEAFRRTPAMLKPIVLLVGAAALAWAERRRLRGTPLWPATRLLAFWLAGALAGVLAVKSMYDHYFLTLLPPLCLLAGLGAAMLPIGPPRAPGGAGDAGAGDRGLPLLASRRARRARVRPARRRAADRRRPANARSAAGRPHPRGWLGSRGLPAGGGGTGHADLPPAAPALRLPAAGRRRSARGGLRGPARLRHPPRSRHPSRLRDGGTPPGGLGPARPRLLRAGPQWALHGRGPAERPDDLWPSRPVRRGLRPAGARLEHRRPSSSPVAGEGGAMTA